VQAEAKRSTTANAIVGGAGQLRTGQPLHFALSPSSTSGLPGAAILRTTNITPSLVLSTQTGNWKRSLRSLQACSSCKDQDEPALLSDQHAGCSFHEISLLLESYPVSSLRYSNISTASAAFEKLPRWLLGLRDKSSCCLHYARCAPDLDTC